MNEVFHFFLSLGGSQACCLQNGHQVLFYSEFAEHRRFLRQIADTILGPAIHRHGCYVFTINIDSAAIRSFQTNDHIEGCCLAGAVRAQQAYDLSLFDMKADAINYITAFVIFYQIVCRDIHGLIPLVLLCLVLLLLGNYNQFASALGIHGFVVKIDG